MDLCPPFRSFLITHIQTHGRAPLDEWSARRRDLYLHRTTQQTNIHAPSGIRTRDPSNQAAADLRLRPRGHYERQAWETHYRTFWTEVSAWEKKSIDEDNIKTYLKYEDVNCTHLTQDTPVAGSCEHSEPWSPVQFEKFIDWATTSFSRTLFQWVTGTQLLTNQNWGMWIWRERYERPPASQDTGKHKNLAPNGVRSRSPHVRAVQDRYAVHNTANRSRN
jgi:hypothetical protein